MAFPTFQSRPARQILKNGRLNCQAVLRIRDMFISDPGSEFFHPGFRVKKIPGSRIRIKELKYFNPQNCLKALGNMIRIQDPDLDFLPIPDPGVKKAPDPDLRHCC
jgi:hypothetical protein